MGANHACAARSGGEVVCWGDNKFGQLGDGLTHDSCVSGTSDCSDVPVEVIGLPSNADALKVRASSNSTCALFDNATLYCWGLNNAGQLGVASSVAGGNLTLSNVVDFTVGYNHGCAELTGGTVQCWGRNQNGELGIGTTGSDPVLPTAISTFSNPTTLSGGGTHSCATWGISEAPTCWGNNSDSQLGDGTSTQRTTPRALATML